MDIQIDLQKPDCQGLEHDPFVRTRTEFVKNRMTELSIPYRAVLDTLPIIAYFSTPDGTITYVSSPWLELFGPITREQVLQNGFAALIHSEDLERAQAAWDAALAGKHLYRDEFRIRNDQGEYIWILDEARPFSDASANMLCGWIGTITSINDQKIHEFTIRTQADFHERLLEASYDCIKVLTLDARLVSMNEHGMVALAIDSFSSVADTDWLSFWGSSDRKNAKSAIEEALAGRQGRFIGRYDVSEEERWWDVTVTALRGPHGEPVQLLAVSRDITALKMQQAERARLRDRLHARTQALVASGDTFLRSLEPMQTIENIANLAVQSVASFCVIDLIEGDHVKRVMARHSLIEKYDTTSHLLQYAPAVQATRHPVIQACFDRISSLTPTLSQDWFASIGGTAEEYSLLSLLSATACITTPIIGQNKILGAITFYLDKTDLASGKHVRYNEEDVFFCEQLARRAGAALSNANSYDREQRIAMEMQKASLPTVLPLIDHLRFTADYRPGSTEATVGGDWYDAFELSNHSIVLTIGDVLGHGLKAAMTMQKLRHAMRAAALADLSVSEILKVTDRMLSIEQIETYATAAVAIYNPVTHEIHVASAGHPAPILRLASGETSSVTVSGLMLGIAPETERACTSFTVPQGSALILYTDGLLEYTHNIEIGYQRLHAAASLLNIHHIGNIAANFVDAVLAGDNAGDDIAVMVATVGVTSRIPIVGISTTNEVVAASA